MGKRRQWKYCNKPRWFYWEKEAVEVKCLSSARHIEAWLTQVVPDEYEMQAIQYFIVNDDLETLYLAFYDPRLPCKVFFYLTIKRKDLQEKIAEYLDYQRKTLAEIDEIVLSLSNFKKQWQKIQYKQTGKIHKRRSRKNILDNSWDINRISKTRWFNFSDCGNSRHRIKSEYF